VLSCGTSAAGTLILGGFHLSKIMGGALGALQQEFCKLELLDNITMLCFENKLYEKAQRKCIQYGKLCVFRIICSRWFEMVE
jgi:hypothetical protein